MPCLKPQEPGIALRNAVGHCQIEDVTVMQTLPATVKDSHLTTDDLLLMHTMVSFLRAPQSNNWVRQLAVDAPMGHEWHSTCEEPKTEEAEF